MAIDSYSINNEQKDKILHIQESHFADVKSKEIAPAKLTRTISGFANADGGEIYVGIEEIEKNGKKFRIWNGFTDIEQANGHIQAINEHYSIGYWLSLSFFSNSIEEGLILHVQISKSKAIIKSSDGTPYVRRGAQNIPVKSHEEFQKLEFEKGVVSYEEQLLNLESAIIVDSETSSNFVQEVIPSSSPIDWFKKQYLIREGKPTVAAILLFADEPQVVLPKRSAIKIYRYRTQKEGSRATLAFQPITIEGCLYQQIRSAVQQTKNLIEDMSYLGEHGLEYRTYPHETLHEIITNAVLHRDYSIAADIHIVIFDNRIEVKSPGKLPGHITPTNILTEQLARNGAIVRIINKFPDPPNKDVGEGLNTAFEAMRKLRLKEPIVINEANSVTVQINHEAMASPEELILEYLGSHSEISNSIAREICGIDSENEMKRVFQRLDQRELIERTPGKRGSASTWRQKKAQFGKQGDLFQSKANEPNA